MIRPFSSSAPLRFLACLAVTAGLSACAINGTPRLSAQGPGLTEGSQVRLAAKPDASEDERAIGAALKDSFARHSITLSDSAPVEVDYTTALRASSVGMARAANGDKADWESTARRRYLLDRCGGERSRVTLVAFDRATGTVLHRSTAEADSCKPSPQMVAQLADQLVDTAIARTSDSAN